MTRVIGFWGVERPIIICSLAKRIADAGMKVLVIDISDMRSVAGIVEVPEGLDITSDAVCYKDIQFISGRNAYIQMVRRLEGDCLPYDSVIVNYGFHKPAVSLRHTYFALLMNEERHNISRIGMLELPDTDKLILLQSGYTGCHAASQQLRGELKRFDKHDIELRAVRIRQSRRDTACERRCEYHGRFTVKFGSADLRDAVGELYREMNGGKV